MLQLNKLITFKFYYTMEQPTEASKETQLKLAKDLERIIKIIKTDIYDIKISKNDSDIIITLPVLGSGILKQFSKVLATTEYYYIITPVNPNFIRIRFYEPSIKIEPIK